MHRGNFGCRPTFCLTALLGIADILAATEGHRPRTAERAEPMATTLRAQSWSSSRHSSPSCHSAYNAARFGSPLNFGNSYQLTVTDMTAYRVSPANIMPTIGSYLLLPLRFTGSFPGSRYRLPSCPNGPYMEPMIGGLFAMLPGGGSGISPCRSALSKTAAQGTHHTDGIGAGPSSWSYSTP